MDIKFFVGLDLGQANDYTALCVLEKTLDPNGDSVYHIRTLERIRGEPYTDVVDKVAAMMGQPPLTNEAVLVVDQTGIGAAVVDMFKKAGLKPVAISIHGGDHVTHEGLIWRVPKRELMSTSQVLIQNDRLRWGWKIKLAMALQGEILNFKCKINPETAHDSYSAWREDEHDDLILAVALACWFGENMPKPISHLIGPVSGSTPSDFVPQRWGDDNSWSIGQGGPGPRPIRNEDGSWQEGRHKSVSTFVY